MKGLFLMLFFSSQVLLAQNNIAIFQAKPSPVSIADLGRVNVTVAPFEFVGGFVVVRASLNGAMGNFILDTGSPGIVLNAAGKAGESSLEAVGVGGEMEVSKVEVAHFNWGGIERNQVEAFSLDLSHLESSIGRKLSGLIGYDLFQNYELFFDYPNQTIKVYTAGSAEELRRANPGAALSFTLNGHVPVIPVNIGHKKIYLGLDSGAEANLLDQSYLKRLDKKAIQHAGTENVVGLDQQVHKAKSAIVRSTEIENESFPDLAYLFTDLSSLNSQFESRLDGLLGYPFFSNHAVAINYKERMVYVWKK